MKALAIILGLVGVSLFFWRRPAVASLQKFYTKRFQKTFGDSHDWESPRYLIVYNSVVIIAGIILVVAAFGLISQ